VDYNAASPYWLAVLVSGAIKSVVVDDGLSVTRFKPDLDAECLWVTIAGPQHEIVFTYAIDGASAFKLCPSTTLIKQYAGEKLAKRSQFEEASRRHLDYFLALAEEGEQKLTGGEQLSWVNRLDLEQQNMYAAINWGMAADLEGAARLAAANWLFWFMRGHLGQGRQRYEALLVRKEALPDALQARLLTGCAAMAWLQGDLERTKAVSEEGIKLCKELGDSEGIAISLHHLGIVHMNRGEPAAAVALKDKMLGLTRTLSDSWLESVALITTGEGYREQSQYESAKSAYEQALILDQERGDRWSSLYAQANLAEIAFEQGEFSEARERLEETLYLAREFGDKQILAGVYNHLGQIALNEDSPSQAASCIDGAGLLK
jgi:tetratricopeptide (TPR) repeat protein